MKNFFLVFAVLVIQSTLVLAEQNTKTVVQYFSLEQAHIIPKGCDLFKDPSCFKDCSETGNYKVEFIVTENGEPGRFTGVSPEVELCGVTLRFFRSLPGLAKVMLNEGPRSITLQKINETGFGEGFSYRFEDKDGGETSVVFGEYDPSAKIVKTFR